MGYPETVALREKARLGCNHEPYFKLLTRRSGRIIANAADASVATIQQPGATEGAPIAVECLPLYL